MQLWAGTSGFQYPEWKGAFYPEKMPASGMLAYYADIFATTEINYSFRRIPSEKTIANWAAATPARFKFTFKAPQKVTHFARLRGCADTLIFFQGVLANLGGKLGAVLFQLPPSFKKDEALLREFLHELPPGMQAAFEFRHASWFADEVFDALKERNAALCIAESAEAAAPSVATADFGYLRLRREDYQPDDIARWAEFVKGQAQWRETFVYFKHEEAGVGPRFARAFMDLTNA